MLNDLNLFKITKGLKLFNRGNNRAIVYVDNTTDKTQIESLGNIYPMITLVSQKNIDITIPNTVTTDCVKIEYKAVPKDKMIYEALGKGLKEYEYYVKSFMFTLVP